MMVSICHFGMNKERVMRRISTLWIICTLIAVVVGCSKEAPIDNTK